MARIQGTPGGVSAPAQAPAPKQSSGGFLSDLWNSLQQAIGAAGQTVQAPTIGGGSVAPVVSSPGNPGSATGPPLPKGTRPPAGIIGTTANAIAPNGNPFGLDFSAVTDFLSYAGWILHPLNWLRAIQFLVGILLTIFGISLLARPGGGGGISARRIVRLAPGGRIIEGRMRGRREAKTQRAVNEGRQQWKSAHP